MAARDPRIDPQPGYELRGLDGQIRKVIRRDGDALWCEDGAIRYKTTLQRWREQWKNVPDERP